MSPPIDERGRGSQVMLLSVRDTELGEMHQTSGQLLVPRSLQSNKDVQHGAEQPVILDDVCLDTFPCPIQAHVEIAVSFEVIWSLNT